MHIDLFKRMDSISSILRKERKIRPHFYIILNMMNFLSIFLLFSSVALSRSFNTKIQKFDDAKKVLWKIHADHPVTLYCGCRYQGKTIDPKSCGYEPHRQGDRRSKRVEWEHVVPAQAFGQAFEEWRNGSKECIRKGRTFKGRKCAQRNPEFARMEADLYNLWPEVGEINNLRSNYSMTEFGENEIRPGQISFGACKAIVADRKFEPMGAAKGIVARVYLYMDQAYPGKGIISNKNEKLFELWNKMHPPTQWECQRAGRIEGIQGNPNPVLQSACKNFD